MSFRRLSDFRDDATPYPLGGPDVVPPGPPFPGLGFWVGAALSASSVALAIRLYFHGA